MTTLPSVTCPSPPSATLAPRRTERIVVPWKLSMVELRAARAARGNLRRFLDEVPRRDTYQEEQRTDDRRRAGNLHGLALALRTSDGVEQRAGAYEIDSVDACHVDRDEVTRVAKLGELRELSVTGAEHGPLPDE